MDEEQAQLTVQVRSGTRRNQLTGMRDDTILIGIAAPPVRGKANLELVKYLSSILGVKRSHITILKGATTKRKLVNILGINRDRVLEVIAEHLENS